MSYEDAECLNTVSNHNTINWQGPRERKLLQHQLEHGGPGNN